MTAHKQVNRCIDELHSFVPHIAKLTDGQRDRESDALKNVTALKDMFKQPDYRNAFSETLCDDLTNWLTHIHLTIDEEKEVRHHDTTETVAEIFRCLRNACAGCKESQSIVARTEKCLQTSCELLFSLYGLIHGTQDKDSLNMAVKCGVQFLGNSVGGHEENKSHVWKILLSNKNNFGDLLNAEDAALSNYTAMVIFSCLSEARCQQLVAEGTDIVDGVLNSFHQNESEWSWFVIEKILKVPGTLEQLHKRMELHERVQLLQLTTLAVEQKMSGDAATEVSQPLPQQDLTFITQDFMQDAHRILSLSQTHSADKLEPRSVMAELWLLCAASSHQQLRPVLQQEAGLLAASINLLHCLHMIGQEGQNHFSCVTKVSEMTDVDTGHPAFGLKKDLIRLIGNLCYQHRENQDKVRELGGLQLLLEHTNIDGRNPFLTQWTVLAVRNLCEHNLENQRFIARLNLQGVANNQELQEQFGITAEAQNGTVIVKQESKPS